MGVRRAKAALSSGCKLRRGSGGGMYTRKAHETREAQGVVSDDQPEAREGQAGRPGVAERFVVSR